MTDSPTRPIFELGSFSTWASSYNKPRKFGDIEVIRNYILRGVPYPVHVPNPPCGGEPLPRDTAFCRPLDDWFAIHDPDIEEIELRSIRGFVADFGEVTFDEAGNATFHYGNLFGLKALVAFGSSTPTSGIAMVIETGKSWANRNRGLEFHYVYLIKHHHHDPDHPSK
jgi:hypothetical protein